MADITQRIAKIKDYFQEMKVANTEEGEYIYITTVFPSGWILDNRTPEKFGVECVTEKGLSYFWAKIDVGLDRVFDAVDFNVKVNKEAQEKVVLFNEKVKELQDIFADEDNDIERLKTLQMVFIDDAKEEPQAPQFQTTLPPVVPPIKKPGRPKKTEEEGEKVNE